MKLDYHSLASKMPIVAVLGAGGGVGKLVIEQLLEAGGAEVIPVVRSPEKYSSHFQGLLVRAGDVTDPASLEAALAGVDTVVFAASGSTYFSPVEVDYKGVVNTLNIAKSNSVKHIVLVSSRLVNPKNRLHPIRVILNNIRYSLMDYKFMGEEAARHSSVPVTIIRPGGLVGGEGQRGSEKPAGVQYIEAVGAEGSGLQGTSIHRADVASVVVAAIGNEAAYDKTVELTGRERTEEDPSVEER